MVALSALLMAGVTYAQRLTGGAITKGELRRSEDRVKRFATTLSWMAGGGTAAHKGSYYGIRTNPPAEYGF